ncbi:ABC transporter ATP-binding protein [Paenibacillus sp. CAU 1782]
MSAFVELREIGVHLGGREIFAGMNAKLERGVSYALIGKSGVGKSTLLNLIAGFLIPDSGVLTVGGKPVNGPRRGTAFLQQELGLFPWQTVREAVSMPLRLAGATNKGEIEAKTEGLLAELGLENVEGSYPDQLSGGQRQRAALARTLIGEPDFLLMDEPTSSLDTVTKESIQLLVQEQQRKRGATLLFVTHDIEEAVLLGDEILLLESGGGLARRKTPVFEGGLAREDIRFYETCIELRQWMNASDESRAEHSDTAGPKEESNRRGKKSDSGTEEQL